MPLFPTSPLDKAKLRSLLAHLAQKTGELPLSAADLRKAREWAIAANLLNEQGLTAEGKLIAQKDPYLETVVTDWVLHFHLSSNKQSLWNYIVYKLLPEHSILTQDELLLFRTQSFTNKSHESSKNILKEILKTYTQDSGISKSRFLSQQQKQYSTGSSDLSNAYTTGYILAMTWERNFHVRESILVDELIDIDMSLDKALGISKESLLQQLDFLAKHEIIEQRSAKPHLAGIKPQTKDTNEFPYQVYRCWQSAIELLAQAYEHDISTPNRPLVQSLGAILDDDDSIPNFSQFLDWASKLTALGGGSNTIAKLAS